MRAPTMLTSLILCAATAACTEAQFSRVERKDGGVGPETTPAPDLAAQSLVCEPAGVAVCAPLACDPVCHTRQGNAATEANCTVFSGSDPARYDDCAAANVCLTDGFGASHCFALCRSALDCPGGRACTARVLAGATSIRVCDPTYRNCLSGCCDPIANTGCGNGQYCYLVPPQSGSQDSWTVCDYVTGGSLRGQPCTTSRDCLQGLACFFATSGSVTGECRQVCDPATVVGCVTGTCTPYAKQWGICSG